LKTLSIIDIFQQYYIRTLFNLYELQALQALQALQIADVGISY